MEQPKSGNIQNCNGLTKGQQINLNYCFIIIYSNYFNFKLINKNVYIICIIPSWVNFQNRPVFFSLSGLDYLLTWY